MPHRGDLPTMSCEPSRSGKSDQFKCKSNKQSGENVRPMPSQRESKIEWTGILCPGIAAILFVWLNPLASHHDDDLMHFLMALWSWERWQFLLDPWGRPGFTIPWALFAPLGWGAAKTFSVVASTVTAWCVVNTARSWKLPAAHWAGWLFWLQPLAFRLSQSTLTEVATSFYLSLALLLHARGALALSAAVFSLTAITRHEMLALLPVWSLVLWRGLGWGRILGWALRSALLVWAVLAVNVASYFAGLDLPVSLLGKARDVMDYGAGTPLSFVAGLAVCSGPVLTALAVFGFAPLLNREARMAGHRGGLLCVALLAGYFALQTVLRTVGLFATGGYPRFLVAISPALALCACAAVPHALSMPRTFVKFLGAASLVLAAGFWTENFRGTMDLGTQHAGKFALIAISVWLSLLFGIWPTLTLFFNRWIPKLRLSASHFVLALVLPMVGQLWIVTEPNIHAAQNLAKLLKDHKQATHGMLTTDVWLGYIMHCGARDPVHLRDKAAEAPPGTLFVWDQQHGPGPAFRIKPTELTALGFEKLFTSGKSPTLRGPLYEVFRKRAASTPVDQTPASKAESPKT